MVTIFAKDSPFWKILNVTVLGLLIVWGLSTGYKEGWVARADVPVLLKILGGFALYDVGKSITTTVVGKIKDEQT